MIVFAEVAAAPAAKAPRRAGSAPARDAQPAEMLLEIQRVRAELQTTREEMQSSQEELRSTNEELQSTNEELQSANQELTSTKEELQSLNEELHTVNAELQFKVDELLHANNDMKNLLDSTDIAIVFLDNELHVRRFTTQSTRIMKLIPGDIGRPITDIASDLLYPALPEDVREVLRTLVFIEKQIATRRGSWFAVRVMPYRNQESRIDGVVITLTDITAAKKLEAELRETGSFYRALFETMPAGVLFQNAAGTATFANPAAEHILGLTLERMDRQPLGDSRWQTVHEDGSPFPAETHPAMVALKTGRPVHDVVMGLSNPSSGQRVWISLSATPFFRAGEDQPSQVFAVFHDITGQKKA
jgi:two-component system CheB/CheR fusion protein